MASIGSRRHLEEPENFNPANVVVSIAWGLAILSGILFLWGCLRVYRTLSTIKTVAV